MFLRERIKDKLPIILAISFPLILIASVFFFRKYAIRVGDDDEAKFIENLKSIDKVSDVKIWECNISFFNFKTPILYEGYILTKNGRALNFSNVYSNLKFGTNGKIGSIITNDASQTVSLGAVEYDKYDNNKKILWTAPEVKLVCRSSGINFSNIYDYFEKSDELFEFAKSLPNAYNCTENDFEKYSLRVGFSRQLLVRF